MSEETKEIEVDLDETKPIEVDLESGKVTETTETKGEAGKSETPVISADEGIASLRQQLEAERTERARLAEEARKSEDRAKKSETEVVDSRVHVIANAIDAVERERDALKRDFREAFDKGDGATLADIQDKISVAAAKLLRLKEGADALHRVRTQAEQAPVPQRQADPVEDLASRLSPTSAAWIRQHPECATDRRMNAKMLAAHHDALAEGIREDSQEYFRHIEQRIGLAREQPAREAVPVRAERSPAPTAAPVSRDATSLSGRVLSPNRVTLSRAEREIADAMDMDYVEYAKHKLAIEREKARA